MHNKITLLDVDKFLEYFVPEPVRGEGERSRSKPSDDVFTDMASPASEKEMYIEIPTRLNNAFPRIGYQFVATPHKADKNASSPPLAPDCGMYPRAQAPKPEEDKDGTFARASWSWIELAIECKKSTEEDPFDDRTDNGEPVAKKRRAALGQILSYAELVFQHQHRMFQYMITFTGLYARIVRIDRSGIFATKTINCQTDGKKLTNFLWRYYQLSPAERGCDTSVTRVNSAPHSRDPIAKKMRERLARERKDHPGSHVTELWENSLDPSWPWWRLNVHDELANEEKQYVVGRPHFQAPGVRGRGTRGYVALALHDGELGDDFVYLKDAWRVKHDDIQKEGRTLKQLNDANVPYVPTVVCHGDLPGQLTLSPEIWERHNPGQRCPLKKHQHYRLVVKEIGKPLSSFTNSAQLVKALYHCVLAHKGAYNAGIIHRDVSAGNILLYLNKNGKWCGLLNDWELSKDCNQVVSVARQPERTGTWQFLSAHVLNNPGRVVVIADELESIFHVLIYYAVRFLRHNIPDHEVGRFLKNYFDDSQQCSSGERCGSAKLSAMENGLIILRAYNGDEDSANTTLRFFLPSTTPSSTGAPRAPTHVKHPLNQIISVLLSWFKAHYEQDIDLMPGPGAAPDADDSETIQMTRVVLDEDEMEGHTVVSAEGDHAAEMYRFSPSPETSDPAPQKQVDPDTKKRADKLLRHLDMEQLLHAALTQATWPAAEKLPDKRPEGGFVAGLDPVTPDTEDDSVNEDGEDGDGAVEGVLASNTANSVDHGASSRGSNSRKRPLDEPVTPTSKRSRY